MTQRDVIGSLRSSGIRFRSHLDGSLHHFTPELATANQEGLGADIIMCFDQCIAYGASKEEVRQAMERTHRWAQACH
ncbi:MAG: tRNA-guanine transglycosylase, partial [candidate division NC10 bacterium]|nr:tRNA-guanine transglycosylase [candidate division NC10 bacterium]